VVPNRLPGSSARLERYHGAAINLIGPRVIWASQSTSRTFSLACGWVATMLTRVAEAANDPVGAANNQQRVTQVIERKQSPGPATSSARPAITQLLPKTCSSSVSKNSLLVWRSTEMSWNLGNPSGGAVRVNSYRRSSLIRSMSSDPWRSSIRQQREPCRSRQWGSRRSWRRLRVGPCAGSSCRASTAGGWSTARDRPA
jgi:hypothetical protein